MTENKAHLAAVVLAGHTTTEDNPLAAYTLNRPKGLVPIAGRPMIGYVVEALNGSQHVDSIVIVGLPPEERPPLAVAVEHLPDQGGLLANAENAIDFALARWPELDGVLISSSDLPLLTPAIIDRFVEACLQTDHDLYYSIVKRADMERSFPTSRRTYVHLVEGDFAGGDLLLLRHGAMTMNRELWGRLASARKSPLRQASMIGLWPVVKLLVGRMGLVEAEQRVGKALNIHGRAVVCADPEVGMDVDKPFQLEIVRNLLEAHAGVPSS